MSELSALAGSEGYGACDDAGAERNEKICPRSPQDFLDKLKKASEKSEAFFQ